MLSTNNIFNLRAFTLSPICICKKRQTKQTRCAKFYQLQFKVGLTSQYMFFLLALGIQHVYQINNHVYVALKRAD